MNDNEVKACSSQLFLSPEQAHQPPLQGENVTGTGGRVTIQRWLTVKID